MEIDRTDGPSPHYDKVSQAAPAQPTATFQPTTTTPAATSTAGTALERQNNAPRENHYSGPSAPATSSPITGSPLLSTNRVTPHVAYPIPKSKEKVSQL